MSPSAFALVALLITGGQAPVVDPSYLRIELQTPKPAPRELTREEIEIKIEHQDPPDFTWDREVQGMGAAFHNENQGRQFRQAKAFYERIPGEKFPDLKAHQQQIVRDHARAYVSGLWSSAQRAARGGRYEVADFKELTESVDLMQAHGIIPSDIGLTTDRMRALALQTAKREATPQVMRALRKELAAAHPICGAVDEAIYNDRYWSPGREVERFYLYTSWLFLRSGSVFGLTEREYYDIESLMNGHCVVRPALADQILKSKK